MTKKLDIYKGRDPRQIPAYTIQEAAHYVRVPEQTLHRWLYGWNKGAGGRATRLVAPADPAGHRLSFVNLVELHVLRAITREHAVRMPKVREAINTLERKFKTPHPLVDEEMQTDGRNLFVTRLGKLFNLNRDGQMAMREILEAHLKRIERDEAGLAVRLYPFTRDTTKAESVPRLVAIDPRVAFGRPTIVGTRIPTAEVADRFAAGDSVELLVGEYGATAAALEEAIRYEHAA
ncbi:MAG: DUF433 domain-containing protein [Vicinamibacterales bacterium]|nr:DUF433 domain-containing protein [Vicinamibacterales bacterium]